MGSQDLALGGDGRSPVCSVPHRERPPSSQPVLSARDVARTRPLPLGAQATQAKESAFSSVRSNPAGLGRAFT